MRATGPGVAFVVFGALLAAGACRARPQDPPAPLAAASARAETPAPDGARHLDPEARKAYDAARNAVREGDHAQAARELARCVELVPDFTEGWYNLGAATARLAVEAAGRGEDAEALQLARSSVDHKKRARQLIEAGTWWIYDAEQQAVVRSDLEHALEDADEVLADEPSLLAALRLQAGAR